MSTEVLPQQGTREDTDVRPDLSTGDGDHERFAHYVLKDKIVDSAVSGTPVIALCGKKWVPSRDPSRFPVCPDCKRIYESIPEGGELAAQRADAAAGVLPRHHSPGVIHEHASAGPYRLAVVAGDGGVGHGRRHVHRLRRGV